MKISYYKTFTILRIVFILFLYFILDTFSTKNIKNVVDYNYEIIKRSVNVTSNLNQDNEILGRKKRFIKKLKGVKWVFPIPYVVDSALDFFLIQSALSFITMETCITFTAHQEEMKSRLGFIFTTTSTHESFLKTIPKYKHAVIKIPLGENVIGNVQRRILITLGLQFEHCRPDRDKYVSILLKNIPTQKLRFFYPVKTKHSDLIETPYDFGSIMHMDYAFSSLTNSPTILPRNPLYIYTVGQNDGLSFLDHKQLNMFYCSNACPKKITCFYGGYQNPSKCNKCKCVKGFTGRYCENIPKFDQLCGTTRYFAISSFKSIGYKGIKNCFIHIFTKVNKKILLQIDHIHMPSTGSHHCKSTNSLEVKYLSDKTATGVRFCGLVRSKVMISEKNHLLIYYTTSKKESSFKIRFKYVKQEYLKV